MLAQKVGAGVLGVSAALADTTEISNMTVSRRIAEITFLYQLGPGEIRFLKYLSGMR
jgi:hypothetical protein